MNARNDRLAARCMLALALSAAPALGCAGTGQPEVSYLAVAEPAPPGEIAAGAWTVVLDEASVAFGPVQFCAAESGSATLCGTAIAELLSIVRVDLLDPGPQRLGRVRGFEGEIRSASFDYGIHWFLTEAAPVRSPEAPGGHSAHLRGRATRGADVLEFVADVDAVPQFQGQRAVPSVAAAATVGAEAVRLAVRFDVGAWVARVDFDALAEEAAGNGAGGEGAGGEGAGGEGAGGEGAGGEGPGDGGTLRAVIAPGSRAHNALVIAMTAQSPPELVWSRSP
ncbi:hypothetical protein WME98_12230 [Sorangium sp. So ce296]|uniref:hypothetical protein n=1 Tax=Sorangium sp. So ce296 TaxID=3133296 RepID=UPI003F631800